MKVNTNKKNKSASRKLVPAVAMLTTSAVMLSSATYAWFTLNREVEVTGLQMTATTPEDIQISLGKITDPGTTGLSGNAGKIVGDNGTVEAPSAENNQTAMLDWSNMIDISNYYQFGRLIPASSTNGVNIFFTPDANGIGKTVKNSAEYFQATNGLTAKADTDVNGGTGSSLAATLHAKTGTEWNASASTAYNVTNDDGYYIDIPIWLRTSSTAGATLKLDAYVIPNSDTPVATEAIDELYKATRMAILPSGVDEADNNAVDKSSAGLNKLIDLQDGWTGTAVKDSPYGLTSDSILNWYGDKLNAGTGSAIANGAVSAAGNLATNNIYSSVTDTYTDGTVIATLPASENGTAYGQMKKYIVRIWLEGEDPECWNANAGQDWIISMKFSKVEPSTT